MKLTDKLTEWGTARAAALEAARAAGTLDGPTADERKRQAEALRERADRLHREIYRELGRGREHG